MTTLDELRHHPVRALAVALSICIACYFIWAAAVDAPPSRMAWIAFALVQLFSAGVLMAKWRNDERFDRDQHD